MDYFFDEYSTSHSDREERDHCCKVDAVKRLAIDFNREEVSFELEDFSLEAEESNAALKGPKESIENQVKNNTDLYSLRL